MFSYSAHISIDVHYRAKLKKKKNIYIYIFYLTLSPFSIKIFFFFSLFLPSLSFCLRLKLSDPRHPKPPISLNSHRNSTYQPSQPPITLDPPAVLAADRLWPRGSKWLPSPPFRRWVMVMLRCALVSGLRSVCVGGGCAVFCGIGLRSDLL